MVLLLHTGLWIPWGCLLLRVLLLRNGLWMTWGCLLHTQTA
jgi:hypothetical protein